MGDFKLSSSSDFADDWSCKKEIAETTEHIPENSSIPLKKTAVRP
jgi:hypothetical protein